MVYISNQFDHKTVPIVLWSGGLDSTYVVYDYLRSGQTVDLIILDMMIEGGSVLRQEKATNLILYEFRKLIKSGELPGRINRLIHHRINTTADRQERTVYGIHQVSSAFEAVTYMLKDYNKEVVFGYVKDDLTIPFLNDFKEAWRLMMKIQRLKYSSEQINFEIPLVFPYQNKSKEDILLELPDNISDNLSWCNVPNVRSECGRCKNCRIMSSVIDNVKNTNPSRFTEDSYLLDRLRVMEELNSNDHYDTSMVVRI